MGVAEPDLLSSPDRDPLFSGPGRGVVGRSGILWGVAVGLLVAPALLPETIALPGAPRGSAPRAPDEGAYRGPIPPVSHPAPATRPIPAEPPASFARFSNLPGIARERAVIAGSTPTDWYNVSSLSNTTLPTMEFTQGTWEAKDAAVLVYGGDNYVTNLRSTWEYRNGNWTNVDGSDVPGALSGSNLAYDPNGSMVVMYGGVASFSPLRFNNTTYTYRSGHWTAWSLSPAPWPRVAGMMAYDPDLGGVVLFGGGNASSSTGADLNDLWLFKGGAWSRIPTPTAPTPRWMGQMTYDPTLSGLVLYGGLSPTGFALSDTWLYAHGNWTRLFPSTPPIALSDGALAYDAALGVDVLTGGLNGAGSLQTGTWTFNGTGWQALSTANLPSGHDAGIGVYDPVHRALVVAGGSPSGSFTDLLSSAMVLNASVGPKADTGLPVSLNVSAAGGPPPFQYRYSVDWGDGNLDSGSSGTFSHAYAVASSESLRVVASEPGGANASATLPVAVRAAPTVSVTLGAPGADLGVPFNLTATASAGWGPPSLAWEMGDGSAETGPTVTYEYASTGTFPVTVWANDTIGGSVSRLVDVAVAPVPVLTLPVGGFQADAGLAAPLGVGIAYGTPPFSTAWTFADGTTAVGNHTLRVFSTPDNESISVSVADAAGAQVGYLTTVSVAPPLSVSVDGPTSLTAGSTGTWSAEISGGTPPYAYRWSLPDGENGSTATVRHLFSGQTGSEPVSLEVTDAVNASASANETIAVHFQPGGSGFGSLSTSETIGILAAVGILSAGALFAIYRRGPPGPPPVRPSRPTTPPGGRPKPAAPPRSP